MCNITTGYTITCNDGIGGLDAIWVGAYNQNDEAGVVETSGIITGWDAPEQPTWYKIQVPLNVANYTDNATSNEQNGTTFFAHQVQIPINKRNATTYNYVKALATARLWVVVRDKDGGIFLLGRKNGMRLSATEGGSGTASGDRNGFLLTFIGEEKTPAQFVTNGALTLP